MGRGRERGGRHERKRRRQSALHRTADRLTTHRRGVRVGRTREGPLPLLLLSGGVGEGRERERERGERGERRERREREREREREKERR